MATTRRVSVVLVRYAVDYWADPPTAEALFVSADDFAAMCKGERVSGVSYTDTFPLDEFIKLGLRVGDPVKLEVRMDLSIIEHPYRPNSGVEEIEGSMTCRTRIPSLST